MKHYLLLAASITVLGLSACKKNDADSPAATSTMAGPEETGMAAGGATDPAMAPDVAASSPAQTFANDAAASDTFEIESSKLAQDKAQSSKVKAFAAQMIKAHTDSTAKLKAAAAKSSPAITPVPQLNATQQQALDDLNAKSGADFDTAYIEAQTQAHQMTLDKLKAYAASGENAPLKAFATTLIPTVTAHLNMAKGL
jgi:putative membrane protein